MKTFANVIAHVRTCRGERASETNDANALRRRNVGQRVATEKPMVPSGGNFPPNPPVGTAAH